MHEDFITSLMFVKVWICCWGFVTGLLTLIVDVFIYLVVFDIIGLVSVCWVDWCGVLFA